MFLSHSHKDRWIARQCARLIEEAVQPHVEVFFNEKAIDINDFDQYVHQLAKRIRAGTL